MQSYRGLDPFSSDLFSTVRQHRHQPSPLLRSTVDLKSTRRGRRQSFVEGPDGEQKRLLAQRFRVEGKALGKGAFSVLQRATDTLVHGGKEVAIKIVHPPFRSIAQREAQVLHALQSVAGSTTTKVYHPVPRLHSAFEEDSCFCLVIDLCGPPVTSLLSRDAAPPSDGEVGPSGISLHAIRQVALGLIGALLLLDTCGIIHGDIKPENILLAETATKDEAADVRVKVVDFGNAFPLREVEQYMEDEDGDGPPTGWEVQTLAYRAPEVLFGMPFGTAIDMWSVGIVLLELWLGKPVLLSSSPQGTVCHLCAVFGPPPGAFRKGSAYRTYADGEGRLTEEVLQAGRQNGLSSEYPQLRFSCDDQAQESKGGRFWQMDPQKVRITEADAWDSGAHLRRVGGLLQSSSAGFIGFMASALAVDPRERLSPTKALCHPFMAASFPFGPLLAPRLGLKVPMPKSPTPKHAREIRPREGTRGAALAKPNGNGQEGAREEDNTIRDTALVAVRPHCLRGTASESVQLGKQDGVLERWEEQQPQEEKDIAASVDERRDRQQGVPPLSDREGLAATSPAKSSAKLLHESASLSASSPKDRTASSSGGREKLSSTLSGGPSARSSGGHSLDAGKASASGQGQDREAGQGVVVDQSDGLSRSSKRKRKAIVLHTKLFDEAPGSTLPDESRGDAAVLPASPTKTISSVQQESPSPFRSRTGATKRRIRLSPVSSPEHANDKAEPSSDEKEPESYAHSSRWPFRL